MIVSLENRSYPVLFDRLESLWAHAIQYTKGQKAIVITDEQVAPLYLPTVEEALLKAGKQVFPLILPAGESTKQPQFLQQIYDFILPLNIDRKTPIYALGGGVIGDLSGFAAATLLRGLPFIQIPTTLVAQVDSAIGGKTGINHQTGKNLIGAFHQPKFVLADTQVLQTLPLREWYGGLAEAIKHAFIANPLLFSEMQAEWQSILDRSTPRLAEFIQRSAAVKIKVVSEDETEQGIRAHLNFGHTFGHAIETVTHYQHFIHGEAIILGMIAALWLSQKRFPEQDFQPAIELLRKIPILAKPISLDVNALIDAMNKDKKIMDGHLRFILLPEIGNATILADVHPDEARDAFRFALQT